MTNLLKWRREQVLGLILYRGPSLIDGAPIVVIATGISRKTANEKTGDMIQTWILREDISPIDAINSGQDESICGGCALRGVIQENDNGELVNRFRGCYVSVRNAPRAIWQAYQKGRYTDFDAKRHLYLFSDRMLRLGAYGDPTAAPYALWRQLTRASLGWTGYTHQWRTGRFWRFRELLMASVESVAQMKEAHAKKWRTFRSKSKDAPIERGEFECPASEEQGKRLTCEECGACNGSNGNHRRASVAITVHGSPAVLGSYKRQIG